MHYRDLVLTLCTIVYYRSVETFALEIILNVATSLNRRVNADAEYAAAEEQKDAHPLQYGPARALPLDLCVTYISTFLTGHLLWFLISSQIVLT